VRFDTSLKEALAGSGYPLKADPAKVNVGMSILVLIVLMLYGTIGLWSHGSDAC